MADRQSCSVPHPRNISRPRHLTSPRPTPEIIFLKNCPPFYNTYRQTGKHITYQSTQERPFAEGAFFGAGSTFSAKATMGSLGTETKYGSFCKSESARASTRWRPLCSSSSREISKSHDGIFQNGNTLLSRDFATTLLESFPLPLSPIISWYLSLKYSPPIVQIVVNIVILQSFVYCTSVFSNSVIFKMCGILGVDSTHLC